MSASDVPSVGRAADVGIATLVLALVAGVWAPVIVELLGVWSEGTYYGYAYLVPVFSAFLVWDARRRLAGPPVWRLDGLGVLASALALLAAGHAAGSLPVRALSLPVAVAGAALFALGPVRARVIAFPIAFLGFMAPLPETIIPALSRPLQHLAAASAHAVLSGLGLPVARQGLSLLLPTVTLEVTEACNGLRFLLAMIVLGTAFGWAARARWGGRALVVAAAIVIAIVANIVRVSGTALLAHTYGPEAAMGFFHLAYGKLVYLLAVLPFAAVVARPRGSTS